MIQRIKEEARPNILGAGIALAVLVLGLVGLNKLAARERRRKK